MQTRQIQILQRCYRNIALDSCTFCDGFYARVFELDPSLRPLFPADLQEQKTKLLQTLGVAVNSLGRFGELKPVLSELGERHVGYGVQTQHYDTVGRALLDTIEERLGDDFSQEVKEAWVDAYRLIASVMIDADHGTAA